PIHTSPSPKGFRKGALLFSGFIQSEVPAANAGFQRWGERGTLSKNRASFLPGVLSIKGMEY
ncbi:MAG TPA: hypothetical protein H9817_09470, partial [Candidatus Mediterraneibacter stercorigallinarum]|nr:hypothetical protein [Candidatus Mediterraneibacter stercorigallinarum]